ncbi:MAG TPA: prolyl oligopeptidase family serine peptidase [Terriglobales bacterium]|nr:prolyl oligopeptidase family serine peptidase [Terriglobales bacterium]
MGRSRGSQVLLQLFLLFAIPSFLDAQTKPKLTLDEFFNWVEIKDAQFSPDGNSVLITSDRADWEKETFRDEIWLYRIAEGSEAGASGNLIELTQSGHDKHAGWSPDGKWIAFLSERKNFAGKGGEDDSDKEEKAQLYLISPNGGEAFAITSGSEEVHSFGWAADSKAVYFATREPWSKQQTDDHKKAWKDVVQYRGDERGDVIFRLALDDAQVRHDAIGTREVPDAEKDSNSTPGAVAVSRTPLRIEQLRVSPDGRRLAFVSNSPSERQEKIETSELYLVPLTTSAGETAPTRLTHNEAVELNIEWARDGRHIFFMINQGSVEKKYEDAQPKLYWIDADSGAVERWFAKFDGEVTKYAVAPDGSVLCTCRLGTEVQFYSQTSPTANAVKHEGWAGSYAAPAAAAHSPRMAFIFSATERPNEAYIADGVDKLAQARPITSFNKLFLERDLPKAKVYRWTSPDGTPVEGMLMYPPGKFEAKNLPMFVLIHGGPQDTDGNHFEADWYVWDRLAATQGWLVFEPTYRGATGYGDKFATAIVPSPFSSPGRDILSGVDALVKDGIADANRLTVGGYSYGGYLTNWLITQTTRFRAAVTGAGAIENVADWGTDDSTFDDEWFMSGAPWQSRDIYTREAAIFQIDKVRTPTHIVAGAEDIRVPTFESHLLDRALHELNVPSNLILFPGEGHDLGKNPWHGKIKVREELKWLEKYGGMEGR